MKRTSQNNFQYFSVLFFGSLVFLIFQCNRYTPEEESIIAKIKAHRQEKNQQFKEDGPSPLLSEDRKNFEGLKYYPIDLSLRFEGPIVRYDSLIPDTIYGTNEGDVRKAFKYGYFEFDYQNETHRLEIFKFLRDEPQLAKYLFLGFTDKTSGDETYGGGRYIDLVEHDRNHYVIDFNKAYNPYCAYNPKYSCAIPPEENHLAIAVTAGEKIFKEH